MNNVKKLLNFFNFLIFPKRKTTFLLLKLIENISEGEFGWGGTSVK